MRRAVACAINFLKRRSRKKSVAAMVRKLFAGRVVFHDGAEEIVPGITVHKIGGHSRGTAVRARENAAGSCRSRVRCDTSLRSCWTEPRLSDHL